MEDTGTIELEIVESADTNSIVTLYKAGGWWQDSYSKDGIPALIKGSFAFVVARDTRTGQLVGMGRAISDKVSDAYIQDVVVLPDYRKQGIGGRIITTLRNFCLKQGIEWLGLIAEPDSDKFYRELGFKPMKGHIPMRYHQEEE